LITDRMPEQTEHEQPVEVKAMPFLEHLEELRKRLLKSFAAVIVMAMVALYFSDHIMRWALMPLGGIKLHVTEITGSIMAYVKVGLISGLIGALPIVFYQLWAFVSPGLYKKEKRLALSLVVISTLLFLMGAAFCYFIMLPWSLKFMIGFSGDLFTPIITVNSYLSYAGFLILAFGLTFEMPIAAYFLGRIGLVSSSFLSKGRRYAIVAILIVAAIITPTPDMFNQCLLAIPMYVLYEVSILVVRFTGKRK
jgi:sec-independent protein translocase protein TatC